MRLSFKLCSRLSALLLAIIAASGQSEASSSFRPRKYTQQTAVCKGLRRSDNASIGIPLRYVDINPNAADTMIMVHGWPGLWSTWSYQIEEFKKDYHLVVPDGRGFGQSIHPGDIRSSGTMGDLVGDLVCVLQHANVQSAICVGHDWGSQVCYEAARMRPDIFTAVVGITIPYIPSAGPFAPIKDLIPSLPKLAYQLYFDSETPAAIEELNTDLRRTIRATLRTVKSPPPAEFLASSDSFLGAWSDVSEIPQVPFFTSDQEDYYIEQYHFQGFENTLHFYMNEIRYASWDFAHKQGNHTIPSPVLSILPLNDPVGDWVLAARLLESEKFLPHLTTETLEGAHWVHLENSKPVNAAIRKWLKTLREEPEPRIADEL